MSRLWYVALPLIVAAGGLLTFIYRLADVSAKIEDEHRAEQKLHS